MTGTEMLFFAVTVYIATLGPILVWQIRYPVEASTAKPTEQPVEGLAAPA